MASYVLLAMFNAKGLTGAVQGIAPIRKRKRQRAQVEHVSPKLVALFRLASGGILRNQIGIVGAEACCESLQCSFGIDMFEADARTMRISSLNASLDVRPER